jgi:hypothetical protein
MEAKAILVETREFPEGTDRAQPDQWPAYNLNLGFDGDAADLGEKGMREFVRQFVTVRGRVRSFPMSRVSYARTIFAYDPCSSVACTQAGTSRTGLRWHSRQGHDE